MKEFIETIGSVGIAIICISIVGLIVWFIHNIGYCEGMDFIKDELTAGGLAEYYIDANDDKAWRIKEKFTAQLVDENKVKE